MIKLRKYQNDPHKEEAQLMVKQKTKTSIFTAFLLMLMI